MNSELIEALDAWAVAHRGQVLAADTLRQAQQDHADAAGQLLRAEGAVAALSPVSGPVHERHVRTSTGIFRLRWSNQGQVQIAFILPEDLHAADAPRE